MTSNQKIYDMTERAFYNRDEEDNAAEDRYPTHQPVDTFRAWAAEGEKLGIGFLEQHDFRSWFAAADRVEHS